MPTLTNIGWVKSTSGGETHPVVLSRRAWRQEFVTHPGQLEDGSALPYEARLLLSPGNPHCSAPHTHRAEQAALDLRQLHSTKGWGVTLIIYKTKLMKDNRQPANLRTDTPLWFLKRIFYNDAYVKTVLVSLGKTLLREFLIHIYSAFIYHQRQIMLIFELNLLHKASYFFLFLIDSSQYFSGSSLKSRSVPCAIKKQPHGALAGWLTWLECCPIHQKLGGSIPGQGTYLGCRFDSQLGCIWEATNWCFSLSLPSTISKIYKHIFLKHGNLLGTIFEAPSIISNDKTFIS